MPSLISLTIAITCFLSLALTLSGPREVCPNERFLTVQRLDVSTAYYNQTNAPIWNPLSYTLTIPERLQGPNIQIFLTLEQFSIDYPSKKLNFSGHLGTKNSTSFSLELLSNMVNCISKLSYRYLLIGGDYASIQGDNANLMTLEKKITFEKYFMNSSSTSYSVPSFIQQFVKLPYAMNYSKSCVNCDSFYSFTGFSKPYISTVVYRYNAPQLKIVNSTHLSITLYYLIQDPTESVDISILLYNSEYYNQPSFAAFNTNFFSMVSASQARYMSVSKLYEKTTLTSITDFEMNTDQGFLNLAITFSSPNSIQSSTSNTYPYYYYFYLHSMTLFTYYCKYDKPYYHIQSDLCYDACPVGTQVDVLNLACCAEGCSKCNSNGDCLSCPYDCFTCTVTGECLSCPEGSNRVLKNKRCVAKDGYYENEDKQVVPCPKECTLCSSATQCTECSDGYQLEDGRCKDIPWYKSRLFYGICLVSLSAMAGVIICCCCKRFAKKSEEQQKQSEGSAQNFVRGNGSNHQIKAIKKWTSANYDFVRPTDCIGCMSNLRSDTKTSCGHRFHLSCLMGWVDQMMRCPICGKDIQKSDVEVTCMNCGQKSATLELGELQSIYNGGQTRTTLLCPDCKGM